MAIAEALGSEDVWGLEQLVMQQVLVLNSMLQAFPYMAVFSFCGESVIIASQEPLRADWNSLENRFYDPKVYADLKTLTLI